MKSRVLIVDDDPIMGNMLESRLADAGFRSTYIDSAAEALEKIRGINPDIVISDVVMPGMDGYELHRRLRNAPDTAGVPFVFLSARTEASDQLEGLRMGADDYVCKPFELQNLIDRMEKVMERASKARAFHYNADFSGNLSQMKLNDIIQIVEMNYKSGELVITDGLGELTGKAFFKDGRLINAETKNLDGEEAFFDLLDGDGFFEFFGRPLKTPERITCGNMAVLLRGSRLLDEGKNLDEILTERNVPLSMESGEIPGPVEERAGLEIIEKISAMIEKSLTVAEIIDSGQMSRSRAASVLADLLNAGVVKARETEPETEKVPELSWPPEIGGNIADEIARIMELAQTGTLDIPSGQGAEISFREGRISHAVHGNTVSEKAFFRILAEEVPRFSFSKKSTVPLSIESDYNDLLEKAESEIETTKKLRSGLFDKTLILNTEKTMVDPGVNDSSRLNYILFLAKKKSNMQDVMDESQMTDLETHKRLMYLIGEGFLSVPEKKGVSFQIITDSASDLPPEIIENRNITLAPISVSFGGKVFYDGINIVPENFYQMLLDSNVFPETSPPSALEFHSIFSEIAPDRDVLAIFQSGQLGRVFRNAEKAGKEYFAEYRALRGESGDRERFRLEIIDSRLFSMGLGLLVLEAADRLDAGQPLEIVRDYIKRTAPKVSVVFTVTTLEYLHNSGLLEKEGAVQKKFHQIKPIIEIRDGGISVAGRSGGKHEGQSEIIDLIRGGLADEKAQIMAAVMHAGKPEWAGAMAERLKKNFNCKRIVATQIGATVGSLFGPDAVGAAWFPAT